MQGGTACLGCCVTSNNLQTTKATWHDKETSAQVALQRSDALRGAFMAHCSLFSRDKFVWVDETGADARDHIRRYSYAIRGMRPVTHRFVKRDTRVNAIAGFSQDGTIALELTSGSVNGVKFC